MSVQHPVEIHEAWLLRLRVACEAGYYRTETDPDHQTLFPWQNKSCSDCPFWAGSICRVHAEYRSASAHTCTYFDDCNRDEAEDIIRERQLQGYRRWWEWFNRR